MNDREQLLADLSYFDLHGLGYDHGLTNRDQVGLCDHLLMRGWRWVEDKVSVRDRDELWCRCLCAALDVREVNEVLKVFNDNRPTPDPALASTPAHVRDPLDDKRGNEVKMDDSNDMDASADADVDTDGGYLIPPEYVVGMKKEAKQMKMFAEYIGWIVAAEARLERWREVVENEKRKMVSGADFEDGYITAASNILAAFDEEGTLPHPDIHIAVSPEAVDECLNHESLTREAVRKRADVTKPKEWEIGNGEG